MYITTFKVEGRGIFPFDMLRYDACYPKSSADASVMAVTVMPGSQGEKSEVTLCVAHKRRDDHVITHERWQSFGWVAFGIEQPKRIG